MRVRDTTSGSGAAPSPAGPSASLHAGPALEVALLCAGLVEELHPLLRRLTARDPRERWQRAGSAAALLRAAGTDPCRALALAARERAVDGDVHVRAEGADPDSAALRHALRVWAVLRAAAAGGAGPAAQDAERYVLEQRASAVLLGAEPDDLPGSAAEVEADVEQVRREAAGERALGAVGAQGGARRPRTPFPPLGAAPPPWLRADALAVALLPGWARELFSGAPHAPGEEELTAALAALAPLRGPGSPA
ncbi:oxygenase MpaB family protein [Kineococcus sp. SYSU DK005]|uniref:oxygenase MpaB family protein n=1 Tax=Kineococcus sp. SYSU DK005 TaxID=3383126 RepID=UPI003D7C49E1